MVLLNFSINRKGRLKTCDSNSVPKNLTNKVYKRDKISEEFKNCKKAHSSSRIRMHQKIKIYFFVSI